MSLWLREEVQEVSRAGVRAGRILLVAFDLPPAPNAGAQRLAHIVGEAAGEFGSGLLLIGPPDSKPPSDIDWQPIAAPLPQATQGPLGRLVRELGVGLHLRRLVRQGSTGGVVISSPLFIPTLMMTIELRRLRIPYLLDVRDPYPLVYVEAGLLRRDGLVHRRMLRAVRAMYLGAQLVTCATKGLAAEVRTTAPGATVRTMRNGHGGSYRSQANPSNPEWFTIGCHGNFGAFQETEVLIAIVEGVLRTVPKARFTFVGRGRGRDLMAKRLCSWMEQGRVDVLGPVPPDDLGAAIAEFDLGLSVRSEDEISRRAFPVRVTDYLAQGIPVLVAPSSEAGRIVERLGLGGTFATDDVPGMVRFVGEFSQRGRSYEAARARVGSWRPAFARSRTMRHFRESLRDAFPAHTEASDRRQAG
jgi:glycosyltransferase involved in cell wall biosynthesis